MPEIYFSLLIDFQKLKYFENEQTALEEYRRRQELMSQPPEQETEETALPCETNFVVSSVQVQVRR